MFIANVNDNGNVFVYLHMLAVKRIKLIIKKYNSCEEKELKVKNFSLRACLPGRSQPNPSALHCLSKLVLWVLIVSAPDHFNFFNFYRTLNKT